jgi:TPR repeat protein
MNSPAVEQLQRIAKSGDVAAMTALGIRLMTGRDAPMSPFDGAQLITDAAAKGDAQAAGIVAVLAGAGACMPQNWPLAFDYLQLAAERG